jgi:hypothetical protein
MTAKTTDEPGGPGPGRRGAAPVVAAVVYALWLAALVALAVIEKTL